MEEPGRIDELKCLTNDDEEQYKVGVLCGADESELETTASEEAERLSLHWCLPTPASVDESLRRSASTASRASILTDLTTSDRQSVCSSFDLPRKSSSSSFLSRSAASSAYDLSRAREGDGAKSSFRRIKELSVLRFYRTSLRSGNGCPHCPQDIASQRRAVHELACGYRLCTAAVRSRLSVEDRCCGRPIPETIIHAVLSPEEYPIFVGRRELANYSIVDRGAYPYIDKPSVSRPVSKHSDAIFSPISKQCEDHTGSSKDSVFSQLGQLEHNNDNILAEPRYVGLRNQQLQAKHSFNDWTKSILERAQRQHADMKRVLDERHQATMDVITLRHAEELSTAEDKQVRAEADMRDLQAREEQDHATALKHMEAFCAGVLSNGEQHNRPVTEQDLAELQKTRTLRTGMALKHANAINILRGEQQRRVKHRMQRQRQEFQALEAQHRREELALEQDYRHAIVGLEAEFAKRRKRLDSRWDVEMAVCLRLLKYD